jgi:protein-tyrosine phosphatase
LKQRNVNAEEIKQIFYSKGIKTYERYQVLDNFRAEYADDLFRAAKVLHELVDVQKKKVFVNDQTGVSRCTTLLLVYLALFIKHKSWKNIDELY